MLPSNITTKTKPTFSGLSSSTTMGKVQGDSWTNETPWGKIAQFSQGRYKSALQACQRNFNDQSQQKWKPGGRIKKINMSKLWSAGKTSQFALVLLLVQNVHVARIFSKPNTQCCKETQSSSGLHSTLYWKLLWLARPLSSFSSTKMRSFSKCYGPKVCTKRLTFLRTNIIFKPGCDNFFVFL